MTIERKREPDFRADWVERHLSCKLTPFQRQAVGLICDAMRCGPYDFSGTFRRANWWYGLGVAFTIPRPLATFDVDGLTRLVIGAHDLAIRVEIEAVAPRYMRVCMWPRHYRSGEMHKRHPTIETAIRDYRRESGPLQSANFVPYVEA